MMPLKFAELVKNFVRMPTILRLLSASVVAVVFFVLYSLVPGAKISVFGQVVPMSRWWMSGAGILMLMLAFILALSSFLMLRRSRAARPICMLGWAFMTFASVIIAKIFGAAHQESLLLLITNGVTTSVVYIYLYYGAGVKKYFSEINGLGID